uniref:IQ motif containing GTPase activating protein 1 n=1 Tax=Pavo cristatus TaxID=9049 RepID=A0A8C9EQB7_PAVCR
VGQEGVEPAVLDNERLTAEEMDERRRQNVAYEYLCHLEEAKRWMEACLNEELPPTTELEEGLRNGVYLAKLGNFFSPKVVSVKKIYDREQTRYKATGLHFRHTDNVIQWLNAMAEIGLPKIFYPETTDIYDRKNMPRCIYCIHALSLYLFKLGLAPQIQDLYGKVDFTEEEISNMRLELEKYGIQMPAFSKIGGILANELSVDEAALHAAVIAINEAIDHQVPADTLVAMKNPNAMLINLDDLLESTYQDTLYRAKKDKMENAKNRISSENSERERDVYEELLTQAEIQGNINKVNTCAAISKIDLALEQGDALALYEALATPALGLQGLLRENCDWYFKQFLSDRQQKQEAGIASILQKEDLQLGVDAANRAAQQYQQRLAAVTRINAAIRMGDAEKTMAEMMNPEAQLPEVYAFAANLYQKELATLQQQSHDGNLTHAELSVAVEMLSSVAVINRALDSGDVSTVWKQLSNPVTGLTNVEDENSQRYIDDLMKLKAQMHAEENEFITWNDIQSCVDRVNLAVHEEHERILAIGLINEALDEGDTKKTLQALQIPAAKLEGVTPKVAQHYQDTLLRAKREKAQDTQDETAVLWLDEIQDGIQRANKDTEESQRFSLGILAINEAVDHGDTGRTLSALRSPDVGLYGVTPECAETYQRELAEVKRKKVATGEPQIANSCACIWQHSRPCILNGAYSSQESNLSELTQSSFSKTQWRPIVGNLLYYRYMNPAIVAPDAFDIIDLSAGGQLTTDQRRNLGSIAKMLQHAASNKMFMGDNAHLSIINEYLSQSYQKFRRFFQVACEVPELQDKFNIDEYSDLVTLTKPVIYISIGEIINTHTLLLDHQDAIAPEHNDPIHELLDDLGEVPSIESLIGEGSGNINDPNREMLAKTEVSLTLTNKFDVPGDENAEMDARTILLNTKRLIVDVIRFQPGETLTEILDTSATSEQEAEHQRAMQKRAIRDAKTPDKMKKSVSVKEDGNLNLQGKKEKIKTGLKKLTELGIVNAKNKYQELINDIAKDIRNQRRYRQRRKAELVKLQQTYSALNSKATFYGEQVDYYKSYIKTCLDNLASKGKVSKKPREMKGKNSKKISLKYTAARLHEKGVLLEIEDLQVNQFKNVIFEISPTEEVGDFEVKAKFMGVQMETFMLHYQDLLQLQYEGVAVMKLFDRAKVNVNLLIFLLNKKFYGK